MNSSDDASRPHSAFATTRWSIVVAAGQDEPDRRRALAALCEAYWYPLYAYARRRVTQASEAQDLTQSFFAELLEKNYVAAADPERGRFRAFLLTAFKHFLSKQWDKDRAQKRGGGRAPIPLSFESAEARYSLEPAAGLTAEQLYDRQWALTLLEAILQRLQTELERAGKQRQFEELKPFLIGSATRLRYADAAARLGITEAAAKMATTRMRRRYRELLRDEIAQTVTGPDEVDAEIGNLFAALEQRGSASRG